jgi:hypothetical protein
MAGKKKRERRPLRQLLSTLAFIVGVAAVVKELRTPAAERTWHGTVAGFVPYDFRFPTAERVRAKMWNEEGPLVTGQVFGVGWTINFGAVKQMVVRR